MKSSLYKYLLCVMVFGLLLSVMIACQPLSGEGTVSDTEVVATDDTVADTEPAATDATEAQTTTAVNDVEYEPCVTISAEELEILHDVENYQSGMEGITLADQKIVKTYALYWWIHGPWEECIAIGEESREFGTVRYITLTDEFYEVCISGDGTVSLIETYDSESPFIKDLQSVGSDVMILDKLCHINEVICFNGETTPMYVEGIVNYIFTDQGTYVKYYSDVHSEAVVFEEAEFERYRKAFYAFRSDPEVSQNEGSEPFDRIIYDEELFEKYSQESNTD